MYLVRRGHKHINFVWAGGFIGSWTQKGTPDRVKGYAPIASAGLARDAKDGLLVQSGSDSMMGAGSRLGGGGVTALEQFASYDPSDPSSVAAAKHMRDASAGAVYHSYPPGKEAGYLQLTLTDDQMKAGYERAKQPQVFRFQKQTKDAFDPNNIGDRMYQTLTRQMIPGFAGTGRARWSTPPMSSQGQLRLCYGSPLSRASEETRQGILDTGRCFRRSASARCS